MVVRFEGRRKKRVLPLFDRLEALRHLPDAGRLTPRQVEHRKRMLEHLARQRWACRHPLGAQ
jgi:hypothetical protein